MLRSARKHLRSVAMLGVAGALVVGGVAVAQNDSGSSGTSGKDRGAPGMQGEQGKQGKPRRGGPHGGPPGLGVPMKSVTYAEFHVQTKDGESKVIRIDQGTVTALTDSSITIKEKDDSEVTVDVDDNTKVRGMDVYGVADLETGQMVVVKSVNGGTAKSISVLSKKGASRKGPMGGHGNGPMGGERKGDQQGPPSGRIG